MSLALTRGLDRFGFRDEAGAPPATRRALAGERIAKIGIVMVFSGLVTRIARDSAQTGHVTSLLLLVSEALVVVLTMIRRPAAAVDRTLMARVLTMVSVFGPLLVLPASSAGLAPDAVTLLISAVGLMISVIGKLSLGRSFGLTPANRGVVSTGLYRVVRHPIYMGYLITHVGFLIANPIGWNVAILAAADVALMLRALREERTLAGDPAYRAYMDRARWRIVPGVF